MIKQLCVIFLLIASFGNAQHQDKVDFIRGEAFIEPLPIEKGIKATIAYEFEILQNVDSVFLDAKNMTIHTLHVNAKENPYVNDNKTITIHKAFKKGEKYELFIDYSCLPKQTVYFSGWGDGIIANEQIWTQGQGKYTSHWLPSFDDMQEKVVFDMNFNLPLDNREVISNGIRKKVADFHEGKTTVSFDMQRPMSSYLLAFVIGNYTKQEVSSKSGITIENYYYPKDSLKAEPTYRYTKEIFDFLEEEIGFAYPWQNYKQIPVHDFLYAGMENTSATIFADGYVIDSTAFVDKNYVNVHAHELAHQWFGDLVTEKNSEHHWLHEGFATYYALLVEKEIFGEDHFHWKLYESLTALKNLDDRGEGQSLLDPKASSLVFYEKGALALYMLKDEIGEKAFKKGIKSYLKKYQYKNVTVSNFLNEMEKASKSDLSRFKKSWLENTHIPFTDAKKALIKSSTSLKKMFTINDSSITAVTYKNHWDATNSIHLKKHILNTYYSSLPKEIIQQALVADTLAIRQTMAMRMDSIPMSLKKNFEALLRDKSYITVENALYKLWVSFPNERTGFLNETKHIIGLPNKNVRLLWLTLSLLTSGYDSPNTQKYFKELSSYTSKEYSWEVRMSAFQYLHQALGLTDESLKNLINASVHHSWQFKKYARNLIGELLKDSDYKIRIENLVKDLKGAELQYINTKIELK